jgi:hypothetical protein
MFEELKKPNREWVDTLLKCRKGGATTTSTLSGSPPAPSLRPFINSCTEASVPLHFQFPPGLKHHTQASSTRKLAFNQFDFNPETDLTTIEQIMTLDARLESLPTMNFPYPRIVVSSFVG